MHLQSLKLLHPTVKGAMHLQEKALFDLDFVGQGHAKYYPVCLFCYFTSQPTAMVMRDGQFT